MTIEKEIPMAWARKIVVLAAFILTLSSFADAEDISAADSKENVVPDSPYRHLHMAEVAVPVSLFREILDRIGRLVSVTAP